LCTQLIEHREYVRTNGEDLPEIRDWQWTGRHDRVTCGASPLKEPEVAAVTGWGGVRLLGG
jgi:xylulose-5-phosphate/fructose-6-phosphate phosphoketolase